MEKLFLETLPKTKQGKIDWKNCINKKVHFIWNDLEGEILIKNYIKDGRHPSLLIQYLDKEKEMKVDVFKRGDISKFIGYKKINFKYDIGTKINGYEVADRFYEEGQREKNGRSYSSITKYYKCKCLKCKQVIVRKENILPYNGCSVCHSRIVVEGINDIKTTRPELVKYFKNIEDCKNNHVNSPKRVTMVCPICKTEKNQRIVDLTRHGLGCVCRDGLSFGEKFFYEFLKQTKLEFIKEYTPSWGNNKRYDFYIPKFNMLIEIHGIQHYSHSFIGCGGDPLEEVISNDNYKRDIALQNGIENYVEIDCQKSEKDYIINSIYNSVISKYIDLTSIDWSKCLKYSSRHIMYEICDCYNKNQSSVKTKNELQLSLTTVIKYLKIGNELNLCNYTDGRHSASQSGRLNLKV